MTVHLCSTVPMGGDGRRSATDGAGRVRGTANVYVNDASLLPDAPGVNPQASVMAIAIRNARRFLADRDRAGVDDVADVPRPARDDRRDRSDGWFGRALLAALTDPAGAAPPPIDPGAGDVSRCGCRAGRTAGRRTGDRRRPHDGRPRRPVRRTARREAIDVIHAAGVIHPATPSDWVEVNARGTANVAARPAPPAFGASSTSRRTARSGRIPHRNDVFRNDEPYDPYLGYGRSKMLAELRLLDEVENGLDAVIVRPPWFYGPHQPARQTTFFTLVRSGRFPIVGDGRQRRSMVYVDDLVDGSRSAPSWSTARPAVAGGSPTPGPYEINEIVAAVVRRPRRRRARRRAAAAPRPRVRRSRSPAAADAAIQRRHRYVASVHVLGELGATIACDISAAQRELGFQPPSASPRGCGAASTGAWPRGCNCELLVTGGNGYFGSLLVGHLVGSATSVRVLDIDPGGTQPAGVDVVVADIRDAAAVGAAIAGIDVVYHCVAEVPLGPRPGRAAIRQRRRDGDAAAGVPRHRRRQGRPPLVERRVRRPRVEPGAAATRSPSPRSRTERRSSPPSGRASTPPPEGWTSRSCDRARSSGTAASASSPSCSTGSPTAPIRSCSATAPTATSSSTPTTSPRCASAPPDVLARRSTTPGPIASATMREAIEHVCAHAGTGARVRSLPAAPGGHGDAADGATRPHPVRAVPLADVSPSRCGSTSSTARSELDWQPRYSNDEMLAESYDWFVANRGAIGGRPRRPHRRIGGPRSSRLLSRRSSDVAHARRVDA